MLTQRCVPIATRDRSSGAWADGSTFELTVLTPRVNTSSGDTPTVGQTMVNVTGVAALCASLHSEPSHLHLVSRWRST